MELTIYKKLEKGNHHARTYFNVESFAIYVRDLTEDSYFLESKNMVAPSNPKYNPMYNDGHVMATIEIHYKDKKPDRYLIGGLDELEVAIFVGNTQVENFIIPKNK